MKLARTMFSREECLRYYEGYTEFNDERLVLKPVQEIEHSMNLTFNHNAIIFGYEYDSNGAETGFTYQMVELILEQLPSAISQFPTFGGYVNSEGATIEENGMMLIYDPEVSPISLGALAYEIAQTFRQGSVLVIHNEEATFVYV